MDNVSTILKLVDRWTGMHQRVARRNKGYQVCDEWSGSTGRENFVRWSLQNGFSDGLCLDRVDNSKGYSPENCQWVTSRENTAKEHRVNEYKGNLYTFPELIQHEDCHPSVNLKCLTNRVSILGWSIREAITRPVTANGKLRREENV